MLFSDPRRVGNVVDFVYDQQRHENGHGAPHTGRDNAPPHNRANRVARVAHLWSLWCQRDEDGGNTDGDGEDRTLPESSQHNFNPLRTTFPPVPLAPLGRPCPP